VRKHVRHPEAAREAHEGRPIPPLRAKWFIALANRDPKRWDPRGYAATREEACDRLRMCLAQDFQGLYDGGWIKQIWE